SDGEFAFTLCTARAGASADDARQAWQEHARGSLALRATSSRSAFSVGEARRACPAQTSPADLFDRMGAMHVAMGPRWRWMQKAAHADGISLVDVEAIAESDANAAPLHPVLIDNCLAAAILALPAQMHAHFSGEAPYLLWSIKELRWFG